MQESEDDLSSPGLFVLDLVDCEKILVRQRRIADNSEFGVLENVDLLSVLDDLDGIKDLRSLGLFLFKLFDLFSELLDFFLFAILQTSSPIRKGGADRLKAFGRLLVAWRYVHCGPGDPGEDCSVLGVSVSPLEDFCAVDSEELFTG